MAVGAALAPAAGRADAPAPPAAPARADAERQAGAPEAARPAKQGAEKVLRTLVNSIRFGRDDRAAAQLAFGAMAARLCGETWAKLSVAEQAEVAGGLEKIIRRVSFERGREIFKYLNAIRFDPARAEGDRQVVHSTVVIYRDLKKTEMVIDWVLVTTPRGLQVVDTIMLGESTAEAIAAEEVRPLVAEGGVAALMAALRKKVAEVEG